MLVAIKTRRISKISTLNKKGENIILNIEPGVWTVIEDINNPNLVLNKQEVLNSGGEVYASLWRSTPPFGEKVAFIRSGFNTTTNATFAEVKSVSKDAILELSKEAADSYDTILQDIEIKGYIDGINALAEKATDTIAGLKSAYDSKRIGKDAFDTKAAAVFNAYIELVNNNSSDYLSKVFGEIIVTATRRKY